MEEKAAPAPRVGGRYRITDTGEEAVDGPAAEKVEPSKSATKAPMIKAPASASATAQQALKAADSKKEG